MRSPSLTPTIDDFYEGNPETLFIAPNVGLEIELRETEYSKDFGYEYKVVNIDAFPLLDTYNRATQEIKGWLSPTRELTLPEENREDAGIPKEAISFTYLYPPRGLAQYINWDGVVLDQDEVKQNLSIIRKSFHPENKSTWALPYIASFGGFVYFDKNSKVIGVNGISFIETNYQLNFEGPFAASKNSYRDITASNLYQDLYLDCFREVGFVGSAWVEPKKNEFLEEAHIKNDHGGFLYFRHDKSAVIFLAAFDYENMTGPSRVRAETLILDAFRLCKYESRYESGSTVSCQQSIGESDLHRAARDGHISHIRQNAGNKSAFLAKNSFGWTPLHYACCYHAKNVELIKRIFETCPEAAKTPNNNNVYPIHLACHHNTSVEVIDILLEDDPNNETLKKKSKHHGFLPLHFACSNRNTSIEVLRCLIFKDSKTVSVQGKIGITPLRIAIAEHHSVEAIELLLRYGSDFSTLSAGKTNPVLLQELNGMLPLHLACLKGCSVDVVSLLLGADVEDKCYYSIVECEEFDLKKATILHIALAHSPVDVINLFLLKEVKAKCTLLEDESENFLAKKQEGREGGCPIHVACARKGLDIHIIKTLLRLEEASVCYTDRKKNRPLHIACRNKDVDEELIELLLETENKYIKEQKKSSRAEKIEPAVRKLNEDGHTPFYLTVQAKATGAHALIGPEHICLKGIKGELNDKLFELVMASRNHQIEMVRSLAQRRYFSLIMLELVANVAATVIYFIASPPIINEGAQIKIYELAILAGCILIFISREIIQCRVLRSFSIYASDVWNWIDCSSILLLIATLIHMVELKMYEGNRSPLRLLFGFTGVLLLLQFIFIIRTTFLPFARFVAGLASIMLSLIPFIVVSVMLLSTFTYSYLISGLRSEDCPNFNRCFLWTLDGFFFGMESFSVTPELDILFGIVGVIVLFNVVIAIVSNTWVDSIKKTRGIFWKSRVDVLLQYSYFDEILRAVSFNKPIFKFVDQHDFSRKDTVWQIFVSIIMHIFWFALGLVTLGIFWPREIRHLILFAGMKKK